MKKFAISILMLMMIIQLAACAGSKAYVATVDGDRVSVEEFNMYLYEVQKNYEARGGKDIWETGFDGKTAEETAKEAALNSIAHIKISAKQAKQMNISLSKEEKAQAIKDATNTIESIDVETFKKIGIDEKALINIMLEKALRNKVFEEVTKNFELSEKDFVPYYLDYIQKNRNELIALDIQYIFLANSEGENSLEKANKVLTLAKSGEDFSKLVSDYSQDKKTSVTQGKQTISKGDRSEEFENAAFSLQVGEISGLVKSDNGYYIIKLNAIIEPDLEELKGKLKNYYIMTKKQQLFEQEYEKWQYDKKIEKNLEVWNDIKIKN
jgi:parvulin-like peptidyl-prolyl isomerase